MTTLVEFPAEIYFQFLQNHANNLQSWSEWEVERSFSGQCYDIKGNSFRGN